MRWSKFKNRDSRGIFDIISQRVFPAVKKMKYGKLPDFDENGELNEIADSEESGKVQTAFSKYMDSDVFLIPNPQVLQKIITGLDDLYIHDISDLDMHGNLYEYMLGKLSTVGQNGQFCTPKHIRDMMVEIIAPTPDDMICDKAVPRLIQRIPQIGAISGILANDRPMRSYFFVLLPRLMNAAGCIIQRIGDVR